MDVKERFQGKSASPELNRFTSTCFFTLGPMAGNKLSTEPLAITSPITTGSAHQISASQLSPTPGSTQTVPTHTLGSELNITIPVRKLGASKHLPDKSAKDQVKVTPSHTLESRVSAPLDNHNGSYTFTQVTPSSVHESITPSPALETLELSPPAIILKQPASDIFNKTANSYCETTPSSSSFDICPPDIPRERATTGPCQELLEMTTPSLTVKNRHPIESTRPCEEEFEITTPRVIVKDTQPRATPSPYQEQLEVTTPCLTVKETKPKISPSPLEEQLLEICKPSLTETDTSLRFSPRPCEEQLEINLSSLNIGYREPGLGNTWCKMTSEGKNSKTDSVDEFSKSPTIPLDVTPSGTLHGDTFDIRRDHATPSPHKEQLEIITPSLTVRGGKPEADHIQNKPVTDAVGSLDIDQMASDDQVPITSGDSGKDSGQTKTKNLDGKPDCAGCKQQISGSYSSALDQSWHVACFLCQLCGEELGTKGFLVWEGRPCCQVCYNNNLAPTCGQCQLPVSGNVVTANDQSFHPDCFVCFVCGEKFGSDSFYVEDGNVYCQKDHDEIFALRCDYCFLPISDGKYVEALGRSFHNDHFMCTLCTVRLDDVSFYVIDDKQYCEQHKTGGTTTSDL